MKPESGGMAAHLSAPVVPWPDGVADATGVSTETLQRGRARGDAPKLYAISERNLVTTHGDLLAWVQAKAVPSTYKCRPAVRRGAKTGAAGEAA